MREYREHESSRIKSCINSTPIEKKNQQRFAKILKIAARTFGRNLEFAFTVTKLSVEMKLKGQGQDRTLFIIEIIDCLLEKVFPDCKLRSTLYVNDIH